MEYKNLPNHLTFIRIILAVSIIYFITLNTPNSLIIAFIIFIIASLTDYLDGYIARKYNLITNLGKILDPIADKLLIVGTFLSFLYIGILNIWIVSIIIAREIIITVIRFFALKKNIVLAAEKHGKHKMISQVVVIISIFLILLLNYILPNNNLTNFLYTHIINLLMIYVLIITLFSGTYYLWTNKKLFKNTSTK